MASDCAGTTVVATAGQADCLAASRIDASSHYIAVGASALEGNTWDGALVVVKVPSAPAAAAGASRAVSGAGASAADASVAAAMATAPAPTVSTTGVAGMTLDAGVTDVQWLSKYTLVAALDSGDCRVLSVKPDGVLGKVAVLSQHHDVVSCVATFTDPSQQRIVSGSWDCTLKLWDMADPKYAIESFAGHTDAVYCTDWSASDAHHFVSGGKDCTFRLWSLAAARHVAKVTFDTPVSAVALSPTDSNTVAVGTDAGTVSVLDLRKLGSGAVADAAAHEGSVHALAFSADGTALASGADDTAIHVNAVGAASAPPQVLRGHTDYVRGVAFCEDTLLSASWDKTVRTWRPRSSA